MLALLQAGMPPTNLPFIIAAFLLTGLTFLSYGFFLFRRRQEIRREIRDLENEALSSGNGE
jgi:CcmD family protein